MDFENASKEELINKINELEVELEDVQSQLNSDKCIKDLDNFIWKLKVDNLYTTEIEEFINQYMRFYND